MLEGMMFLATAASFDQLFSQLEQAGAFRYILPFLFIFALVFGILVKAKLFEDNKGINFIISFAVGLMAVQTNYVSNFFIAISPRIGAGLVILLIATIFLGLVMPKQSWVLYIVFGVGAIILVSILLGVAKDTGSWWYDWWITWKFWIILAVVGIIIFFISTNRGEEPANFGDTVGKLLKGFTD